MFMCRYTQLMSDCWNMEPDERPDFSELVVATSSMLQSSADYLDLDPTYSQATSYYVTLPDAVISSGETTM